MFAIKQDCVDWETCGVLFAIKNSIIFFIIIDGGGLYVNSLCMHVGNQLVVIVS